MDKFLIKRPRLEKPGNDGDGNIPSSTQESTSTPLDSPSLSYPEGKKTGRTFQLTWFTKFNWLEFDSEENKAFCKTCKEALVKGLLTFSTKKEDAFTTVGFSNWKKATEKFKIHENTHAHKESTLKIASTQNVYALMNDKVLVEMKKARTIILSIFSSLRFLCRQGLSIRGHEDSSSNFHQLLNLRKEDRPELEDWLKRSNYKWLSHDIQNEIIEILGQSVLKKVVQEVLEREYFGLMIDETCDLSVREQVSVCLRTVDENLDVCEDFVGFYTTPNTEAKTLFEIVKDTFTRLGLKFEKLRGQCYDGAAQMQGKFKGLQKLVKDLQPQALYVHCAAHSLNLAVLDCLKHLPAMRDAMNLSKDLIQTVRESPKRMELLTRISTQNYSKTGLRPLCPTRWTMRASSINSIIKNYSNLVEFFEFFSETDCSDVAAKCSGYLEKMSDFKTFFSLYLYSYMMSPVEEVNQQIQSSQIGASEINQKIICLSEIINGKRDNFERFWEKCIGEKDSVVDEPKLPRHRSVPKRLENLNSTQNFKFSSPKDFYRQLYLEVADTVLNCLNERFEHSSITNIVTIEEECVRAVKNGTGEFPSAKEFFKDDLDCDRLLLHLNMLHDISKQRNVSLDSIKNLKDFILSDKALGDLFPEVKKCLKLLHTIPVTTCTAERSFSSLRRLKTYLRSTMGQERLNYVAILNTHQTVLDELDLRSLVNEFIGRNQIRKCTFAAF